MVQDLATQWIQAYPCKTKTSQETQRSLQKFLKPDRKPKVIYTDNSLEFGKACEDLSWNQGTSTPNRSETHGIAERTVRSVKEGTSEVLLQSGLDEKWWADSMECYTYLRNVTDLLSDGKTPYERRFGQPFKGPIIPFGSLVEYHPKTAKDQSRIHQFGKKVLPGLFLGYALYAGEIWKGDVLVADLEELETMDASEIYSKRLNAKEVIFPKEKGDFIFPLADGRIKPLGGDQDLRTSTLIRQRPVRGESHLDFLGESEGSLPPPQDSFPDAGEAINDFWSMSQNFIYRHHVEPRVKLYPPREESFPIPLKYIDVSRTTHTNLDVKQERRIDDYWNIDGSRDFVYLKRKADDAHDRTRSHRERCRRATKQHVSAEEEMNNSSGYLGDLVKDTASAAHALSCGVPNRDSNGGKYLRDAFQKRGSRRRSSRQQMEMRREAVHQPWVGKRGKTNLHHLVTESHF